MRMLTITVTVLVAAGLVLLAAGQFGWLRGTPPTDLGVKNGRLKPPSRTENSVSSQARLWPASDYAVDYAAIDPLRTDGDAIAALGSLKNQLAKRRDVRVVVDQPDYLRTEFETRWLRFTDDVEFWVEPGSNVIHVRSSSRLGRKDFGVNRARIDAIRASMS